jgi:hypothetical protein
MKTKTVLIIIASMVLTLVLVVYYFFPWGGLLMGIMLGPSQPAPKNTYGEFPFRIVYEVDGERFVIEDTLICEYKGRGADAGRGKFLRWDVKLASGADVNESAILRLPKNGKEWQTGCSVELLDRVVLLNSGAIGSLNIDIGGPQYYLGYYSFRDYSPGTVFYIDFEVPTSEELLERHGLEIIETEFSLPMVGNGIIPKTR